MPDQSLDDSKLDKIKFFSTPFEACQASSAVVVLTEWDEFKDIDYSKLIKVMDRPSWMFDCRGFLDKEQLTKTGFLAYKLGSPYPNLSLPP